MYIHCCNRAELARCVETTVCHNCAQQTGTIDTCQGANAHWAMPHLSGRRSSLLKRVRFGYGSLTNLFSTTLSIQANSRVLTLTVSAKRKPVHSSYRDVTTKSERVIAHVIGSNLLCRCRVPGTRTRPAGAARRAPRDVSDQARAGRPSLGAGARPASRLPRAGPELSNF